VNSCIHTGLWCITNITRYDYNLTIMKSPKPATDNQFKKLQYCTHSTLSNFNDISYVGRLWCPKMIPDIEKCLPVAIFKMAVTNSTLSNFNDISYVGRLEIFWCQESNRDIIIYPHMKWGWNRTMLNLCGIVAAILKMTTGRNFSMSGINSTISTGRHFQNVSQKFNIVRYHHNLIYG
jgi:hypothetical protein